MFPDRGQYLSHEENEELVDHLNYLHHVVGLSREQVAEKVGYKSPSSVTNVLNRNFRGTRAKLQRAREEVRLLKGVIEVRTEKDELVARLYHKAEMHRQQSILLRMAAAVIEEEEV